MSRSPSRARHPMRLVVYIALGHLCLGLLTLVLLAAPDLVAHGVITTPVADTSDWGQGRALIDELPFLVGLWKVGLLPVLVTAWALSDLTSRWWVLGVVLGAGLAVWAGWFCAVYLLFGHWMDVDPFTVDELTRTLAWVAVLLGGQAVVTVTLAWLMRRFRRWLDEAPDTPATRVVRVLQAGILATFLVIASAVALKTYGPDLKRTVWPDQVAMAPQPPPPQTVSWPPPTATTPPEGINWHPRQGLSTGAVSLAAVAVSPRVPPPPATERSTAGAISAFAADACWLLNSGTAKAPTSLSQVSTVSITGQVNGLTADRDLHLDPRRGAYRSVGQSGDPRRPDAVFVELLAPTRRGEVVEWVRVGGLVSWEQGEWQIVSGGRSAVLGPDEPDRRLDEMDPRDQARLLAGDAGWRTFT